MASREFDVQRVENACERYLEERKNWIKERREILLKSYMEKENAKKLFFFFKRKPLTKEKAIEELKLGGLFGGPWYEISQTGEYWSHKVEKVLAMTKAQGGSKIRLDVEEFNLIKDYL